MNAQITIQVDSTLRALSAANDILAEVHVPVDEAIARLRAFILKTEHPANKAYAQEVLAAVLAEKTL
jgi:hypothetical protein